MPLGHRVSKDVAEQHAADEKLAATYRDAVGAASAAEGELRRAQSENRPDAELRRLAIAFDQALAEAIKVARAAERAAMGPKTYALEGMSGGDRRNAEIAARKAKARTDVRVWTDEVDRLRTARERHLLSFRAVARSAF